jgi:hypothetical protein
LAPRLNGKKIKIRAFYVFVNILKVILYGSTKFTGFLLQARLVKTDFIVGTWSYDEKTNPNIGVIKCFETNVSITSSSFEFNYFS